MGMFTYSTGTPALYSLTATIIEDWWKRRKQTRTTGTTKAAQAHTEGWVQGLDLGVEIALAAQANRIRCEMYGHWPRVPLVMAEDVRASLTNIALEHEERVERLPVKDHDGRRDAYKGWLAWAVEEIENRFALPEELESEEIERHRAAVLRGEEPANEEDADWIAEVLAKQKAEHEKLVGILTGTNQADT